MDRINPGSQTVRKGPDNFDNQRLLGSCAETSSEGEGERQLPNYLHRSSLKSLIIIVTRPPEVIRTTVSEKMSLLCITRVKTLSHRACSLNLWLLMLKCSSLTLK